MCTLLQLLVVLIVFGRGSLPLGEGPSTATQVKPASKEGSELARIASDLQTELGKVVDQYPEVLKTPWLRYAITHFSLAEQKVKSLVVDGKPNYDSVAEFHYGLSCFIRALDELPDWEPRVSGWGDVTGSAGAAKRIDKPDAKQLNALAKALKAIQTKANRSSALQAPERVAFDESTTPADAAEYGSRAMTMIERMLYEGTLAQVTGEGKAKTTEVMKAPLEKLKSALANLGTTGEGGEDPAKLASALGHSVSAVKQSIAELRRACAELIRYHAPAKPRVELVLPVLDVLESNVAKVKASKSK